MTLQATSDHVDPCRLIAAIMDMFEVNLRSRQAERERGRFEAEQILPTAPMMILLPKAKLAENSLVRELVAWHCLGYSAELLETEQRGMTNESEVKF